MCEEETWRRRFTRQMHVAIVYIAARTPVSPSSLRVILTKMTCKNDTVLWDSVRHAVTNAVSYTGRCACGHIVTQGQGRHRAAVRDPLCTVFFITRGVL